MKMSGTARLKEIPTTNVYHHNQSVSEDNSANRTIFFQEKWKKLSHILVHSHMTISLLQMCRLFRKKKRESFRQKWNQIAHRIISQNHQKKLMTELRKIKKKNDSNRNTSFSRWKRKNDAGEKFVQILPKTEIRHISRFRNQSKTPTRINNILNQQNVLANTATKLQVPMTEIYFRGRWSTIKRKLLVRKLRNEISKHHQIYRHKQLWIKFQKRLTNKNFKVIANKMKKAIFNEIVNLVRTLLIQNHLSPTSQVNISICYQTLNDFSIFRALSSFTKQLVFKNNKPKSIKLDQLDFSQIKTINKDRMKRIILYMIENTLFPYMNSDIDNDTSLLIVNNYDLNDMFYTLPEKSISSLNSMSPKDTRLYVNDQFVYDIVDKIFYKMKFPICLNDVNPESLVSIANAIDFSPAIPSLKSTNFDSLFLLQQHDDKYYTPWSSAYKIIDSLMCKTPLPLQRNNVTSATCKEIVREDQFEEIDIFSIMPVHPLLQYAPSDDKTFSLYSIADSITEVIMNENEIPIIPNIPSENTINEIIDDIDFEKTEEFSILNTEKLQIITSIDMKKYVNQRIIDEITQNIFDIIEFPIVPNTFDDEIINRILQIPIDDSLLKIKFNPPDSIINYRVIDTQLYVNDLIAESIVNDVYTETDIPLIPNIATDKTFNEIIEDDFKDITSFYSILDYSKLDQINPYERRIRIDKDLAKSKTKYLLSKILNDCPIVPNIVDNEASLKIAEVQELFGAFSFLDKINTNHLNTMSCIDMQKYINSYIIEGVISDLMCEIKMPLCANDVTEQDVLDITQLPINDSLNALPLNFSLKISHYTAIDMQYYVNINIIESVMEDLYIATELPIISNEISESDIDEILMNERYEDETNKFSYLDLDALLRLNPFERRIDFNFPINEEIIFNDIEIPIVSNDVSIRARDQIVKAFSNVEFYDYNITGLDFLMRYEAPPEILFNLDEFIEKLEYKMLYNEMFNELPLIVDCLIPEDITDSILSILINEQAVLKGILNYKAPLTLLSSVCVTDIPLILSPDDVVDNILWNSILTDIPLDRTNSPNLKVPGFMDDVEEIVLTKFNDKNLNENDLFESSDNDLLSSDSSDGVPESVSNNEISIQNSTQLAQIVRNKNDNIKSAQNDLNDPLSSDTFKENSLHSIKFEKDVTINESHNNQYEEEEEEEELNESIQEHFIPKPKKDEFDDNSLFLSSEVSDIPYERGDDIIQ
ncbi:hypothetical protein TRFO_23186 [Tritrichomonas foetus]|uniref:Uncharacterized protein n=1 Tax=Tritrichomonas foetus TaxID=1144522 RepID=A0A1J4KAV4_9EUKA|nr:hypothetical protein TRFO_23186 [Tritrichomonas foetus]|eukprot:OHT08355.1 hypothetical protein TRFO_23186 [Tritrichomonas foetus]